MIRLLYAEISSIRIEEPGLTKAEFVVSGDAREFHQVKRSHQSGRWSIAVLGTDEVGVLKAIWKQLTGNADRFVFVSSSDARELAELSERATQAETTEEFETAFLASKEMAELFARLRAYWDRCETAAAYDILRRIEIRTIDERSLEQQVEYGIRTLFLANPSHVSAALHVLIEESVHQTITRDGLIDYLAQKGFRLRQLAHPGSAGTMITQATDRYIDSVRRKLIQRRLLPRATTQTLVSKLGGTPSEHVITGKAGGGKTASLLEFIDIMRGRNVPVLAIRLDRLQPPETTHDLGQQLDLEESPVLVLEAAAGVGNEGVLIIDQLDAVSVTSGRATSFLDVVEGLLIEARSIRVRVKLHVFVVCRKFDWENDHRLRHLLAGEHIEVHVVDFSVDEVKQTLSGAGFDPAFFHPRQLRLLQLPQNLSLFLESGAQGAPTFNTAKELFDRYWDEKRRAIGIRTEGIADHWIEVIEILAREMTAAQQLFVMREKLDRIPRVYLDQMTSEGVLTFDGRRYGFGHESFFDYCFARSFVTGTESLIEFLVKTEQHLFRRAQVRQVLAYLREADRVRYVRELRDLLSDTRIRPHIKDLAFALLASVPDPGDDEYGIFEPSVSSVLSCTAAGQANPDKLTGMAWDHFFSSASWFQFSDNRALINGWLTSANDPLVNLATNYLRFHQRTSAERVAALLEPYADVGGDWKRRLASVVEWADHASNRRFFELLLRLIDNGTLDDARGPIAVNSTFWSLFYDLEERRPEWIPEVTAHWLRRRLILIETQQGRVNASSVFGDDNFAAEPLQIAGAKASQEFVDHVLPVVLDIADRTADRNSVPPRTDAVWYVPTKSTHPTPAIACLSALSAALKNVAQAGSADLQRIAEQLRQRDTYIANFLLFDLYASAPARFVAESVALVNAEPRRFECGFSDSRRWCAMEWIRAVAPVCSPDYLLQLESAILNYVPPFERTADGYRCLGYAAYSLLSAIPEELRSPNARRRYEELDRKFPKPPEASRGIRADRVRSPIEEKAADKMADDQWLSAIAKYSCERVPTAEDFLKGGVRELALMWKNYVVKDPQRFGELSLRLPDQTHVVYWERTLDGIKGANVSSDLKLAVCQKAYAVAPRDCGGAIADVLGSIDGWLPDNAFEMLTWLATEHPDPEADGSESTEEEDNNRRDIFSVGFGSTRGRAATAIRDLIIGDPCYIERFRQTLHRIMEDGSVFVRSCGAYLLEAVAYYDAELATALLSRMNTSSDGLVASEPMERLLGRLIGKHFESVRGYVEQALRSPRTDVCIVGARLASIAALSHAGAIPLAEEAAAGSTSQRLGVAQVAAANSADKDCRAWCEQRLMSFFNDEDKEVRRESASCFRYLQDDSFETHDALIAAFCDSRAYEDESSSILYALDQSRRRLPGTTCMVCEKFLARFGNEARDIRTSRAADVHIVNKLAFRTYQQHPQDEWTSRSLDLVDRLCLEGIVDAKRQLDEIER